MFHKPLSNFVYEEVFNFVDNLYKFKTSQSTFMNFNNIKQSHIEMNYMYDNYEHLVADFYELHKILAGLRI